MRYKITEQQAKLIREALENEGMTLTSLAEFVGVKYKAVWQWLSGRRSIDKAHIILMSMCLEGSLDIYIKEGVLIIER